MEEVLFHHTLPIQLRFNDVDQFGHVNNTVYFSFYDLGKSDYIATVCPPIDTESDGVLVVHIETDFLAQIAAGEPIAVQTAVTAIGNKSFDLLQRAINTTTGEVKCVCRSVMVAFDLKRRVSKPLNPEWVEAICRYENRDLRTKHQEAMR